MNREMTLLYLHSQAVQQMQRRNWEVEKLNKLGLKKI